MATSIKGLMRPIFSLTFSRRLLGTTNVMRINSRYFRLSTTYRKKKTVFKMNQNAAARPFIKYKDLIERRNQEAQRSVLIQIPSQKSSHSVLQHLQSVGRVKHAFHFQSQKDWLLVEFERDGTVSSLLRNVKHFSNLKQASIQSRILFYYTSPIDSNRFDKYSHRTQLLEFSSLLNEHDLHLNHRASMSEKMIELHEKTKLSEIELRLRFFVSSILEGVVSGIFPKCKVIQFGSCVNGLGLRNSDLDMILYLSHELLEQHKSEQIMHSGTFLYLTKQWIEDNRKLTQMSLRVIGNILEHFIPYCFKFHYILNARIPIVKFFHEATLIECDLSMENFLATKMSELLYLFGEIDSRFRPLVTTVKHWAREQQLTQNKPGGWVTNFTLTILVVFFLQTRAQPILPTIKLVQKLAGPQDKCISNDIDYSFAGDISRFPQVKNKDSLESLLREFFNYYKTFDFEKYGLSIIEGCVIDKPKDYSLPMYIENPLEIGHNISQNVVSSRLAQLQEAMKDAFLKLGSKEEPSIALESIWKRESEQKPKESTFDVLDLFANSRNKNTLSNAEKTDETESVKAVDMHIQDSDGSHNGEVENVFSEEKFDSDTAKESNTAVVNTESLNSSNNVNIEKINGDLNEAVSEETADVTTSKL